MSFVALLCGSVLGQELQSGCFIKFVWMAAELLCLGVTLNCKVWKHKPESFSEVVDNRAVKNAIPLLLPSGNCPDLLSLFLSPSFFKEKVHDTPSTYSQPWPFSTLPQTFGTSMIIRLSLPPLRARFSNRRPPANLTRSSIVVFSGPSSDSCSFWALWFL